MTTETYNKLVDEVEHKLNLRWLRDQDIPAIMAQVPDSVLEYILNNRHTDWNHNWLEAAKLEAAERILLSNEVLQEKT